MAKPDKRPRNRGQRTEGIGRARNRGQSRVTGGGYSGGTTHGKPRRSDGGGDGGSKPSKQDGCCPMVAGLKAIRRGKFRLGRRYLKWSFWIIVDKAVG